MIILLLGSSLVIELRIVNDSFDSTDASSIKIYGILFSLSLALANYSNQLILRPYYKSFQVKSASKLSYTYLIQWNMCNADTWGLARSVLIIEVS